MGQYLSACLSSDATDDDAYNRRDIEFLEEQAQRILDLQCRVNEIAQSPQVLKKSSYKPDQIVTLVDGIFDFEFDGIRAGPHGRGREHGRRLRCSGRGGETCFTHTSQVCAIAEVDGVRRIGMEGHHLRGITVSRAPTNRPRAELMCTVH